MSLPEHWKSHQEYLKPEIVHACDVLGLDHISLRIPPTPSEQGGKSPKVVIVVPGIQPHTINAITEELNRTHDVPESKTQVDDWEDKGVFLLPVSQTRVEQFGPWRGFTTKVLECLEQNANPVFVFAGTSSYASSCSSKARKIILESSRQNSPFKNSDLFKKLDEEGVNIEW